MKILIIPPHVETKNSKVKLFYFIRYYLLLWLIKVVSEKPERISKHNVGMNWLLLNYMYYDVAYLSNMIYM